jgi:hypothetical protein
MNLQVIKKRIQRILAYTITAFLFFLISAFLILQIPPVQNYFIGKFLKDFTQITGFTTTVKSFRMLWFDRLELQNVSVYDPANNQMIKAREILINFKLSQLWENKNVNIDGVFVDSAHVFVTKINESDTSRDLNMNVFIYRINQGYSSGSGANGATRRGSTSVKLLLTVVNLHTLTRTGTRFLRGLIIITFRCQSTKVSSAVSSY